MECFGLCAITALYFTCLVTSCNGRVSACRYRQKQKRYRKFPPASILAWMGQRVKTLKNLIFCQKWPILIIIFVLSSKNIKELVKNSAWKKYFKKLHQGNFLLSSPLFRHAAPKFVYKWYSPIVLGVSLASYIFALV